MADVSPPAANEVNPREEGDDDDDPPSGGGSVGASGSGATKSLEAGRFHDRVLPGASSSVSAKPDGSDLNSTTEVRYVFANLDQESNPADFDQFYSEGYEKRLAAMIDHVVDTEGPVHEAVLIRRIARHHGVQRVSNQFRETVAALAQRRRGRTEEDVGRFFWRKGTVKNKLAPARYEGRDDELCDLEMICKEELRSIRDALAIGDDPVLLARRLGAVRVSQAVRLRLERILRK